MTPTGDNISFGYCWCGCGKLAPIATKNRSDRGQKKGEPLHFLRGHQFAKPRPKAVMGRFKIDGVYCRLIPLTQGLYAIVDESDYEWLSGFRWFAVWSPLLKGFYAVSHEPIAPYRVIQMHRLILGLDRGDPRKADHRNPEATLDNRRANIRIATNAENARNRRGQKGSASGTKGVTPREDGSFRARITVDSVTKSLGSFRSPQEAHEAYCRAAIKYHGKFWHP